MERMTPKEFQIKYDFTDNELEMIRLICKLFNGKVVAVTVL